MAKVKLISYDSPTKDFDVAEGTTISAALSQAGIMSKGITKLNSKEVSASTKLYGNNNIVTIAASKIRNADDINDIAEDADVVATEDVLETPQDVETTETSE